MTRFTPVLLVVALGGCQPKFAHRDDSYLTLVVDGEVIVDNLDVWLRMSEHPPASGEACTTSHSVRIGGGGNILLLAPEPIATGSSFALAPPFTDVSSGDPSRWEESPAVYYGGQGVDPDADRYYGLFGGTATVEQWDGDRLVVRIEDTERCIFTFGSAELPSDCTPVALAEITLDPAVDEGPRDPCGRSAPEATAEGLCYPTSSRECAADSG